MWPFDRNKKFIQSLGKGHSYTPDMTVLEQGPYQLVFLCDDMKRAHNKHGLIEEQSRRVSRGFTYDKFDFRVGNATGKALPFADKDGLRVKGEIYAVRSEMMPRLDNHYLNGVEFVRVRLQVLVVGRNHQLMSIGNEEFLRELPPGCIRTVPELQMRHYLSNREIRTVSASMYVAMKKFWKDKDINKVFPTVRPTFPEDNIIWLPKYYRYPIERNRCQK